MQQDLLHAGSFGIIPDEDRPAILLAPAFDYVESRYGYQQKGGAELTNGPLIGERATAIMHIVNSSKSKVVPAVELNRHLTFRADGHRVWAGTQWL